MFLNQPNEVNKTILFYQIIFGNYKKNYFQISLDFLFVWKFALKLNNLIFIRYSVISETEFYENIPMQEFLSLALIWNERSCPLWAQSGRLKFRQRSLQ